MESEQGFDSVRLGRLERERLLDELERARSRQPELKHQKRRYMRVSFRQTGVGVTVETYGGSTVRFRVCARNISRGGLGFLHGGFLHPGSPCDVVLTTLDRERRTIPGRIAQCRFVTGRLHEVGVRFAHEIDLRLFCRHVTDDGGSGLTDVGALKGCGGDSGDDPVGDAEDGGC